MRKKTAIILLACVFNVTIFAQVKYSPDWTSLDERPVPAWFSEAKFGIIVHWGVYSVPAYRNDPDGKGSYAEWYAPEVMYKPWRNNNFHERVFGADISYRDLADRFSAELWDARQWSALFKESGAKYVLLTAKHHDGFCLWDTEDTFSGEWNSMDSGPGRDLVGELASSVRASNMKFGVYYSLLEWESTRTNWPFDNRYTNERTGYYIPETLWQIHHIEDSMYADHLHFQIKELANRYSPSLIYADGAWDQPDSVWKSKEIISWLYNKSPSRRELVINDMWGSNTPGLHGSYFTSKYGSGNFTSGQVWEKCVGMGYSYGLNRDEELEDYKSSGELIELLARTVCSGGNLLLNVAPSADGRIPLIQQERLEDIGRWMDVNGKAIYKSKPYLLDNDDLTYTRRDNRIYAFLYEWSQGSIKINLSSDIKIKNCNLLGLEHDLVWKRIGPELLIIPPVISPDNKKIDHVYVFEIELD